MSLATQAPMTAEQRRITYAICVIVGLTLLVAAGLTFLVEPMAIDLGLTDEAVEDALVVPAIASLLVVFIAGRAGDRLGPRRTMLVASVCFSLGSVVLAAANGQVLVQSGLALCGIGAVVIQVVAVSVLQQTASEGKAHVSAFTSYGMVFPFAFLVLPIATASALGSVNWRWVPVSWAVAGLIIAGMSRFFLKPGTPSNNAGEWLTPVLAGVTLAAGSVSIAEIDNRGVESTKLILGAVVCLVAASACAVAMRTLARPSFSLRPLSGSVMRALMTGVVIVSLIQIITYVCIALEYFYDLTALEAAVAIAPAQIGAIIGAKVVAKSCIRSWGISASGRRLLMITGLTMLTLIVMKPATPMWYLIGISTVFSCAGMAALTVLNLDIMGRAPQGHTGEVSSFRTAASSIGTAAGMAVLGAIVLSSIQIDEGAQNVGPDDLAQLASALRIDGILSFVVTLIGWIVLLLAERRTSKIGHTVQNNQGVPE